MPADEIAVRARETLERVSVPPDPRADRAGFLRLDLNEDLSGPLVRIPLPANAELGMYLTAHALQHDLARVLDLDSTAIKITAGADEAIYGLMRAFLDPGDGIVLPKPTFVEFPVAARSVGAAIEAIPYGDDLAFPYQAFAQALRRRPRMAVVVSPANPTGEALPPAQILALAALSPETLLLVDEAYAEYNAVSVLDAGMPPANVAVIRTFSKAYGLASARVGYLIARPAILDDVRKVLPAYSLAGPSLALARANLAQRSLLARRVAVAQAGKQRIAAWGRRRGILVHETATNFVLLRFAGTGTAQAVAQGLEARGILVSDRTRELPGTLRVTVGAPRHVRAFLEALAQTLA